MDKIEIFLGRNLQYLRRKKNLTQIALLEPLGISRSTWSNYEKERTTPTLENLVMIARMFEVTLDEMISQDLQAKADAKKYTWYLPHDPDQRARSIPTNYQHLGAVTMRVENLEWTMEQHAIAIKELREEALKVKKLLAAAEDDLIEKIESIPPQP